MKSMNLYNNLLSEFAKAQLGYATIAIIAQSCIGAIAAMMILMNESSPILMLSLLFVVTVLCLGFNMSVLIHWKPKPMFNTLLTSLLFSILVIIVYLI